MGDYNVAWEIKDDVSARKCLVGRGKLSQENQQRVAWLVAALQFIPADVSHAATGKALNLRAMNHAS